MGTRADFYVGRGLTAEWLGSVAWDGYPSEFDGPLLRAGSEDGFRLAVKTELDSRDDATTPDQGWPWPWENSGTTDYAYAYDDGNVWASNFGAPWFDPLLPEPEGEHYGPDVPFPDMTAIQNVDFGRRSGVMFISAPHSPVASILAPKAPQGHSESGGAL